MSTCSLAISEAKRAFEKSKARAKALSQTMEVTREGEVLAQTVKVADAAIKALNEKDFAALNQQKRGDLVNSTAAVLLREELTDIFEGGISANANSRTKRQKMVLKSASFDEETQELTVTVTPEGQDKYLTYTFPPGAAKSNHAKTSNTQLYIPQFGAIHTRVANTLFYAKLGLTQTEQAEIAHNALAEINKMLDEGPSTLQSATDEKSRKFNYKRASLRKNYVHGSREDMKNILADLHALAGSVSSELYAHYNSLLEAMHPHFFRDMNVYINENAEHTFGWVDLDKNHILLNVSSKLHEGMSNEEVYMHETVHTMIHWALQQTGFYPARLKERLKFLHQSAYKQIKWQDLATANPDLTAAQAKSRYDYIFSEDTSEEEFIAYALTNPAFMQVLEKVKLKDASKTGFLNAVKSFFADLLNAVMGNYKFSSRNSNLKNEIHVLAFKLAEINNGTENVIKDSPFALLSNLIDKAEGRFEEWAVGAWSLLDSKSAVEIPENMNRLQKILFLGHFFLKGIYNKEYRKEVGRYFTLVGIKPDSSIREIVRSMAPKMNKNSDVEMAHLHTNQIDSMRNSHVTLTARNILDKFKKRPTEDQENALTSIFLESNAGVLLNKDKNQGKGYSTEQMKKLLTDVGYRKQAIGRTEARIRKKNQARANWIIGQAGGLGRFMATGLGHQAQLTNSRSIAIGHGTQEYHNIDKDLLNLIEELVALRALDHQKSAELKTASEVLHTEEDAVKNIINLYEAFKRDSQTYLFADDPAHMMEGYIKELFDDTIDIRYEPLTAKNELEKKGYTLVTEVRADTLSDTPGIGVFVSNTYGQAERLRGAVGLGNPHGRGLSLKEVRYKQFGDSKKHGQVYFERDKISLDRQAKQINKALSQGQSFTEFEDSTVPILDASGKIVNYRTMMSKQQKAKFLRQDKTISNVLSKTSGSVIDKVAREEQNKRVLNIIKSNVRNVYDKGTTEEYTLLSADHIDPKMRQLFFMLPQTYRDYANARADKSLPIPSVLMDQYFGYAHTRFTDLPGVKALPVKLKHIIDIFESYWQDLIKIAKGNILLKMPSVLIGNIVSNVVYAVNNGMPISEIVGAYTNSFRDVKAFMKAQKGLEAKQIELKALTQNYFNTTYTKEELAAYREEVKRLQGEITLLQRQVNDSEVKELFDIGMYQSVVDDIELYKLGDTNRVSSGMDKLLAKAPTVIRTPLQIAYLSKETAWYQFNQEVLQLSDLVARDVMNRKQKFIEQQQADGKKELPLEYRKLIKRESPQDRQRVLDGKEREEFFRIAEQSRHTNLLNSFINYNLPNGKGEEYLNRIGLLMFTKYLKRIQQVITTTSIKHPIRSVITLLATSFMMDVDKIQDQALIVKAFDNNDFGFLGVVPVYNPVDTFLDVTAPPLIRLVTEL